MNCKNLITIILSLLVLFTVSCKDKKQDIEQFSFKLTKEKVLPMANGVKIEGTFEIVGDIRRMEINVGQRENLLDADSYPVQINGNDFIVEIDSLAQGVTYYYCYSVFYGNSSEYKTSTSSFTTVSEVPTVLISEVVKIDDETYRVKCEVTSNGGSIMTERGICWNTYGEPNLDDEVVTDDAALVGEYVCRIEQLTPNTTCHVRAYAKNALGTGFSNEVEFVTGAALTPPSVITIEVTEVTKTTAISGGIVTDGGGTTVTERGICWSWTNTSPTIDDTHISVGTGLGSFTAMMAELTPGTPYYVRAYATNSVGVAYGEPMTFTTLPDYGLPIVVTHEVTEITKASGLGAGSVIDDGGAPVTERGICWSSANPNPTIDDDHLVEGAGLGEFTALITGLTSNTKYFVRAFATNCEGTGYGDAVFFITLRSIPTGAINGVFSINASQKVYFSQGNLQYNAAQGTHSVATGGTEQGTWRFAEHQWDIVGAANSNISSSYNGWIDLFGWGTSGWNSGNTYYQPYNNVKTGDPNHGYGYGPTNGSSYQFDLTGSYANADWGVYNAISNGGDQPNMWRTLTIVEWNYVLNLRNCPYRFAKAQIVSGGQTIKGLILLPDDWNTSTYTLNSINAGNADFASNQITSSQWLTLEQSGAVFLPGAGYRDFTQVNYAGTAGYYWSASYYDVPTVQNIDFGLTFVMTDRYYRYGGESVRLVTPYED